MFASIALWWLRRNVYSISLENSEDRFHANQRRRRRWMLALGVFVAVGIAWGVSISYRSNPVLFVICWGVVVFFLFWIILLGLLDLLSIHYYFRSIKAQGLAEEALLRYQLQKELEGQEEALTIPSSRDPQSSP